MTGADAVGLVFGLDEDPDPLETALASDLDVDVWLAAPSPDAGAIAAGLATELPAAPRTLARRRPSAAAASPSDWLEASDGASEQRSAIDSAAVV